MCGNFGLTLEAKELKRRLESLLAEEKIAHLERTKEWTPLYLTKPSFKLPVVKQGEKDQGKLEFDLMPWGLRAHDWKNPSTTRALINAKAETVFRLPSFRTPIKKTRCLAFADYFFEPDKDSRQPWLIRFKDKRLFAFASIYSQEVHEEKSGRDFPPAWALLTTEPNELVGGPLNHHRMPVILTEPEDLETWLNPNAEPEQLKHLLRPYPAREMEAWEVNKAMYKSDGKDPAVTAKVK